ncbi:MAG: epoxyqueuosine reductase QueH [Clostridiales bacterium]|nr:epoxyqueuosine reductase QueH [Clostridiales bacterium]
MTTDDKKLNTSTELSSQVMSGSDYVINDCTETQTTKPELLLHSCCGPCSTSVIERLVDEFNVTVFFYNPCITDEEEYRRRREAQIQFIEQFNEENAGRCRIVFREGDYCPGAFFEATAGLGNEPEGGARCEVCFRQRLEKTAAAACISGADYFGTTLTVSPHKDYKLISEIGRELALKYSLSFLDRDFKKKDGFARSIQLSRKYSLYRQNYCGCKYSERER